MPDRVLSATTFLGRERELAEGAQRLRETRLLTITGPGGAGKTRFALELARRVEGRFAGGSTTCLFASLRDPTLVLPTIARALDVQEEGGRDVRALLAERLAGAEHLLVLDNLEHLPAAAGDVEELLEACPALSILATSRGLLRSTNEVAYELPPLGDDESVALFCERARVEPTATVGRICARLEGLPLAIELAAARLGLLSPEQLLERLASRLDLLKGSRDADPRQQTLRATLEWSYELLTPDEQQLFSRLAVFAGGCRPDAAENVCDARPETLRSLVDKSLLRWDGERYSMLETVRELAEERLELSGEASVVRDRHAEHLLALMPSYHEFDDRGDLEWLHQLVHDGDNVRAALVHLERSGRPDRTLELASSFWAHWYSGTAAAEGRRILEGLLARTAEVRSPHRARALMAASALAVDAGDLDAAETFGREALALLRSLDEIRGVAPVLTALAIGAAARGDDADARHLLEDAARSAHAAGERFQQVVALLNLSEHALVGRELERAEAVNQEALALLREIGSDWGMAVVLVNRAYGRFLQRRDEEALAALRDSMALPAGGYDVRMLCNVAVLLAGLLERRGRLQDALRLLGAADGLKARRKASWSGTDGELRDELAAKLRALDGDGYESAAAAGRELAVEDAQELVCATAASL